MDLCELYALENHVNSQEKAEIEEQMDEAAILTRHTKVEVLKGVKRNKKKSVERSVPT